MAKAARTSGLTVVGRPVWRSFNTADMNALAEVFDEKAIWHTPGKSPVSGDFKGRDAILAHFGRMGQETGGTVKAELRHLIADEEGHVVGVHHSIAERGGKHLGIDGCIVFELKQGKVVSAKEYVYDLHAADAFWS